MFKLISQFRKPLFLFPFTLFLTLLLCLPWVSAKIPPKPKPQPWQIEGIIAALDDSYPEVKGYAFGKLYGYDSQDLKAVLKKPEDIALIAVNLLKDKSVNSNIRGDAADAVRNLREAAAKYVPDIANILKDEKVDQNIRYSAGKIAQIVSRVSWQRGDMSLLETHYNNLKNGGYKQARYQPTNYQRCRYTGDYANHESSRV